MLAGAADSDAATNAESSACPATGYGEGEDVLVRNILRTCCARPDTRLSKE